MIFTLEVLIYVDSVKEPVFQMSKIELSKSKFLTGLVSSLNFCDSCLQPVSIIIVGEASLSQLKAKYRPSKVTDPKVLALSRRLVIMEDREETETMEDNTNEEFEPSTDFCNNNIKIKENNDYPKEYDDFRSNPDIDSNGMDIGEDVSEKCTTNVGTNEQEFNIDQSKSCFTPERHNNNDAMIENENGCSDSSSHVGDNSQLKKKTLECKLCLSNSKDYVYRSCLFKHYSRSHFRDELVQFIDTKSRSCLICGKRFNKNKAKAKLLSHVGCVHNKLENYLPKNLQNWSKNKTFMDENLNRIPKPMNKKVLKKINISVDSNLKAKRGLLPEDVRQTTRCGDAELQLGEKNEGKYLYVGRMKLRKDDETNIENVVESDENEDEIDDLIDSNSETELENVISEENDDHGNTEQEEVESDLLTILKVEEGAITFKEKVGKDTLLSNSTINEYIEVMEGDNFSADSLSNDIRNVLESDSD